MCRSTGIRRIVSPEDGSADRGHGRNRGTAFRVWLGRRVEACRHFDTAPAKRATAIAVRPHHTTGRFRPEADISATCRKRPMPSCRAISKIEKCDRYATNPRFSVCERTDVGNTQRKSLLWPRLSESALRVRSLPSAPHVETTPARTSRHRCRHLRPRSPD